MHWNSRLVTILGDAPYSVIQVSSQPLQGPAWPKLNFQIVGKFAYKKHSLQLSCSHMSKAVHC